MIKHFRVAGSLHPKLEESGVRVSAVLLRAGLPQDLFEQTRILVTTEELFARWRAIGEVSDDPAVARAFRGWEGVPPSLWREVHRETAVS